MSDERLICRVTPRVRVLDGARPGETIELDARAARAHARRGRVIVLGPPEDTGAPSPRAPHEEE